ncbi:CPBP family intramembrane glutamic endopeptidase [Leeuwenhoekiella parthenopeia]|uniref:CPBP family intramembrane metalloprotease n=1 Tax=Leeuwenhoekiella parthenopeia TaxID=2890320 RepID=A0ABS8GXW2_9FLAO|nr:CPBP family intramembrane metalloprotease [Leeuwenhoekiella parthenopeia]
MPANLHSSSKKQILYHSLLWLFGLYLLIALIKTLLSTMFQEVETSGYSQSGITEMLRNNPFKAAVMILVVAPVVEECMHRSLLKPSHLDVVLFCSSWIVYATNLFIPEDVNWLVRVLFLFIFLGCLTYIGVQLFNPYKLRHLRVWLTRHYKWIWIVTSISFGLMHITNYVAVFTLNLPLFFNILPRIASGFIFGYIKLKNRHILWSVAAHALNNLVPFIILVLLYQLNS